ncbi:MAG: hypothetical protein FWG02_09600 [Holophagaceae bacterium]|nr:hypothetical protein [Holophagaceae bacterium]
MAPKTLLTKTTALFSGLCLAASAFLSCSGGGGQTPEPKPQATKLQMSQPNYSDTTKLVTWNIVPNASGYAVTLKQGNTVIASTTIQSNQYEIKEQQSGTFDFNVLAKGNGTTYLDSDPRSTTVNYTKIQEATKLQMSQPSYNDNTKLVTWAAVPNSNGYDITLRQGYNVIASATIFTNQYEITGQQNATYDFDVLARGNGVTHLDSDPRSTTVNYTKEKEQNTDPYNQHMALYNALLPIAQRISGQNLTEQQQKQTSDQVKAAFVDGFARDQYSKYLPFSSKELERVFNFAEYKFPNEYNGYFGRGIMTVGTMPSPDTVVDTIGHETGHFFGFGESLTELMVGKYMHRDLSSNGIWANLSNPAYSAFHDNLLFEIVGGEKFYDTIYGAADPNEHFEDSYMGKPTEAYGKMWDENLTVTINGQKKPLVKHKDFQIGRQLGHLARNRHIEDYDRIVIDFEQAMGIKDLIEEMVNMGHLFYDAIKTNDPASIKRVQDFYASVVEYGKNNKHRELTGTATLNEWEMYVFQNALNGKNLLQDRQKRADNEIER